MALALRADTGRRNFRHLPRIRAVPGAWSSEVYSKLRLVSFRKTSPVNYISTFPAAIKRGRHFWRFV